MPTLKSGSVLLPDVGMSQSGLMVAALIGGFVVYLALKQKLGAYWSILIGGQSTAATTSTGSTSTGSTSPSSSATPSGGGTVAPGLTVTSPLYQGGSAAPAGGGIVPGPGGTLQLNPGQPLFGGH